MKVASESNGSNSHSGEEIIALPSGRDSTTNDLHILPSADPVIPQGENEKTVISQRPVAAPEEFYRSMPLSELATLLEGKQLDHFQVEQMVGGGGMGAVFRGRDLRLDRIVAIKVIPASKRDAETLRRFRLEAQSAARLDHPNIARVYYVGEAEQWNYIVFEFIDGINIRDLVDMEGPLGVDDAVFYTRQVAEALEHAHERNVVHRDIKPSNVLVTPLGIAKVVDMGLARDTSLDKSTADATASGVTLGTFDYISPEQARNPRDADVRSDLYSLGCTLFFMLTGNPPFPEGTALQKLLNHGSQPPPDPRAWREDVSDQLFDIIMKLMAKRPIDRYQRPLDLINDLLLLAEAEDLPRSRTPGTVLLTPSVAQRSLLESNLPWMVALAFLLGSTLWLQSVHSISGTFAIPPATINSVRPSEQQVPAVNAVPGANHPLNSPGRSATALSDVVPGEPLVFPSPPDQPLSPAERFSSELPLRTENADGAVGGQRRTERVGSGVDLENLIGNNLSDKPTIRDVLSDVTGGANDVEMGSPVDGEFAKRVTTLVVSESPPAGIDRQSWASSLSSALRRSDIETDIRTIEIAGRVPVDNPVRINRTDLTIRAAAVPGLTGAATLEFSPQSLARLQPGESLIELGDRSLQCLDVNFDILPPGDAVASDILLFGLYGSGKLELDGCRITAKGAMRALSSYVVSVSEAAKANPSRLQSGLRTSDAAYAFPQEPVRVSLKNCFVRGDLSFMRVLASQRIEVEMKSALLAIRGYGVDVQTGPGDDRMPPVFRVYCQQSTFATAEGFARFRYREDSAPSLAFNRTSRDCVYWAERGKPHIVVTGVQRSDELEDLMHLQGEENAYDAQIEVLCQCRTRDQAESTIRFSTTQAAWFNEFGNEWSVIWKTPVPLSENFGQVEADGFELRSGMFMPGYGAPSRSPR
jgi:eukaryotic-like serine/threonine-protein kinase